MYEISGYQGLVKAEKINIKHPEFIHVFTNKIVHRQHVCLVCFLHLHFDYDERKHHPHTIFFLRRKHSTAHSTAR